MAESEEEDEDLFLLQGVGARKGKISEKPQIQATVVDRQYEEAAPGSRSNSAVSFGQGVPPIVLEERSEFSFQNQNAD